MKKGQYITTVKGWTIRLYNSKGGASYLATKPGQGYKIDESLAVLKSRIVAQAGEGANKP